MELTLRFLRAHDVPCSLVWELLRNCSIHMVLSALMVETCLPPCPLDAALANSTGSQHTQAVAFMWSSHQSILQTLIHGGDNCSFGRAMDLNSGFLISDLSSFSLLS